MLGYPIRTSSDPRSVDNSPRHIAASHVLHRPLMPRHPPCALTHLHTKTLDKKLQNNSFLLDARNHYPQLKHHTPPPKTARRQPPQDTTTVAPQGVLPQSPIACLAATGQKPRTDQRLLCTQFASTTDTNPNTARCRPNADTLSWCSLERR